VTATHLDAPANAGGLGVLEGLTTGDPALVRDPERRLGAIADIATGNAHWLRRYSLWLFALDLVALVAAAAAAIGLRDQRAADATTAAMNDTSHSAVVAAIGLVWIATLVLSRSYEPRFLVSGPEEYRRVANASMRITAAAAVIAYLVDGAVVDALPVPFLLIGTCLLVGCRIAARAVVRAGRRRGQWTHRVLVVGARSHVGDLACELDRDPRAGYHVVGAVIPGGDETPLAVRNGAVVPVAGKLARVGTAILATGADTVAVAGSRDITQEDLRLLAYELEGTGVDLLVSPALTHVTGSRVSIRPVAGLPLLHLDEPELAGVRKIIKGAFDIVVAAALFVLLAPVLLVLGLLVRATSPGPALFVQERVGLRGTTFRVFKFRTMAVDAEQRLAELMHLNEHDGVLFKVRNDPRITRVGAVLRKYSLDELPQLLNVLRGEMSLVGPRPPLPSEVARYEGHTHRRLLVRPGITGLWQVSGRSELSWEETVRLDLQYVENWSLGMDIAILARTAVAVLARRGAY